MLQDKQTRNSKIKSPQLKLDSLKLRMHIAEQEPKKNLMMLKKLLLQRPTKYSTINTIKPLRTSKKPMQE